MNAFSFWEMIMQEKIIPDTKDKFIFIKVNCKDYLNLNVLYITQQSLEEQDQELKFYMEEFVAREKLHKERELFRTQQEIEMLQKKIEDLKK